MKKAIIKDRWLRIAGAGEKVNRAAGIISAIFGLIAAIPISNRLWFQMLQFAQP